LNGPLKRYAKTNLNAEPYISSRYRKHLECLLDVELFVHDRGGVLLNALEGYAALLF
jgi:hypothetical protein